MDNTTTTTKTIKKEIKSDFPTEIVTLPSTGYFYPEDNPLTSGTVEIKYMTAREEDILTSRNLITKGIVLDKLLESLIQVTHFISTLRALYFNYIVIPSSLFSKYLTFRAIKFILQHFYGSKPSLASLLRSRIE